MTNFTRCLRIQTRKAKYFLLWVYIFYSFSVKIEMDRKRNEIARSLSMVTQLGISMLAPLILCVCVGIWLDDTFGWSTTAVLVVLGIMAGARNTWMLAQQVGLPRQKRRKKDEKTDQ